jgi:hypothetical protein
MTVNQRTPALDGIAYQIAPFDFVRDGDAASCVPEPGGVIPAWLALPTDDPAWMPDSYKQKPRG